MTQALNLSQFANFLNASGQLSPSAVQSGTYAITVSTANGLNSSNSYTISGLTINGAMTATGNITAYYSDIRLKTKVGDITNPLEKIRKIETLIYHANELAVSLGYDASIIEVGLNAQTVQLVQPEAVAPAPIDPKYLTVRYERLVPLLLEGIKELENRLIISELIIKELKG